MYSVVGMMGAYVVLAICIKQFEVFESVVKITKILTFENVILLNFFILKKNYFSLIKLKVERVYIF